MGWPQRIALAAYWPLLTLLRVLRSSGLLGVTGENDYEVGPGSGIANIRNNDYGPGRRIFVKAAIWM